MNDKEQNNNQINQSNTQIKQNIPPVSPLPPKPQPTHVFEMFEYQKKKSSSDDN